VTWATSVPILAFLGVSVLDLGPMYATDWQTDVRQTDDRCQTKASLNASALSGWKHNKSLAENSILKPSLNEQNIGQLSE